MGGMSSLGHPDIDDHRLREGVRPEHGIGPQHAGAAHRLEVVVAFGIAPHEAGVVFLPGQVLGDV